MLIKIWLVIYKIIPDQKGQLRGHNFSILQLVYHGAFPVNPNRKWSGNNSLRKLHYPFN